MRSNSQTQSWHLFNWKVLSIYQTSLCSWKAFIHIKASLLLDTVFFCFVFFSHDNGRLVWKNCFQFGSFEAAPLPDCEWSFRDCIVNRSYCIAAFTHMKLIFYLMPGSQLSQSSTPFFFFSVTEENKSEAKCAVWVLTGYFHQSQITVCVLP